MKYLMPRLFIALFLVAALVPLVTLQHGSAAPAKQQSQSQASGKGPENKFRKVSKPLRDQYIVVLKNDTRPEDVEFIANQLLVRHQGTTRAVYRHTIKGFAIQMPEAAAIALSNEPEVAYVEEDGIVKAAATQPNPPWGLDRIDQRDLPRNNTYNFANVTTGAGVHAYILDSGINPAHPEFLNANGSSRASQDASFWFVDGNDCAQHGTPVASVIGGNTVGVAKNVRLHSVKVLDCWGDGAYSSVIAGVEWVTANHIKPAIVNMSFSGEVDDTIENAIRASMAQTGLAYVVAAGNDGVDAKDTTPARMPEVITVGATDRNDTRAVFNFPAVASNWGPALDVFAPGDDITAAWPVDNGFDGIPDLKQVEGTSVAAAHVTGVLARFLQALPNVTAGVLQGVIKNLATPDKVQDRGQGSPNLLLYSEVHAAFVRQVTAPSIDELDTQVDSGMDLGPNEFLAITGTGSINSGVFLSGANGPEGWNSIDNNPALPLPGSRPFSLLGILDGQRFYIGKSTATTEKFPTTKRLFLRTNDDHPGDGSGAFNAQIQAWKPLPDALSNFIGQSVPKTLLLPGETMNVSITMRNVGPTTWTAGQAFRLGSMSDSGWPGGRAYLPNDVPPNTDVTFSFPVTAPATPGNYTFRWRMLQEGVQFFGDATTEMPITVLSWTNDAQFVSQSVKTTMYAGEPYNVSVTMRNTGNSTWPANSVFRLGSQNPQDNLNWGLNRVQLTQSVPPGGQVTFNFTVSAPGVGKWDFRWRMVQEGVEWFGAYSDLVQVTVKLPPCLRC
jgi:subtilase family protein/Ig-like domain-containing protein/peptidase inhibitor I9